MDTTVFNSKKYGKLTVTKKRTKYDFIYTVDKDITEEDAKAIQIALGYHPAGYSFHGFKKNTWTSYNNCN